jgi:hypothetical protein
MLYQLSYAPTAARAAATAGIHSLVMLSLSLSC